MGVIIEVNHLKKTYKKRRSKEIVTAVNDISFTVNRGEILGLLGPNGAGKTSTIKMICGLLIPDEGSILINGKDNQKDRLGTLRHISAVLEGNRNLYWRLSVRENLEYFAGNRGLSKRDVADRIEKLLVQFNIKDKENELVNRLSRGMQQKLAIAVAMLADTDIILLDEPTLGLDVETGYEVRELLRGIAEEEDRTIIISSHDMAVIQDICDRTIIINHGEIVTNDKVDNLLRLFDVRSYKVKIGGTLSESQLHMLKESLPHFEYTEDPIQSELEVDLAKSEDIYQLFDILKQNETAIESIEKGTINFEQIFMKIVKGEDHNVMDQSIESKHPQRVH